MANKQQKQQHELQQEQQQMHQEPKEKQEQPHRVFALEPGVVVDDNNKSYLECSPSSSRLLNDDDKYSQKVLSEKLNKLSLEERTKGIHELHGVADDDNETPEMIAQKLRELTKIAEFANEAESAAYQMALAIDKDYVERIKLLCLRADYYDSEKAASRVIAFFTFKLSLFGDCSLARDITFEDFNDEDKMTMKKGLLQLLQERDRAGRAVILMVGKLGSFQVSLETWCRMFCYFTQIALRDTETQRKGVVFIAYSIGQEKFVSNRPETVTRIWWLLPVRLAAMHMCYDSSVMRVCADMMSQAMESQQLCRFRGHFGSYQECLYNLMTFGIPKHVLPFSMETGELELGSHHAWLDMVCAREEFIRGEGGSGGPRAVTPVNEIAIPGPMDIIVGRGCLSRSSTGYLRMRNLVLDYQEKYEGAKRSEKTKIAKKILLEAQEAGCRFVRWTPEGLVECDEVQAREKISHTFRNMRRRPPTKSTTKDEEQMKGEKRDLYPVLELS